MSSYVLLDVFTDTPLEGNPLAVFPDARAMSAGLMQRLARELNLSETVFVLPARRAGDARVRIFTPRAELPFAGHPVLGCAIVLGLARERAAVTLETGAGPVSVRLRRTGAQSAYGSMAQPIPSWASYEREAELLRALGVERPGLPVEVYRNGPRHVFVELSSEADVAALRPDLPALAELDDAGVSCFAGSAGRWKTRMFLPALGVPEDPATGSAAGPLAVHLSRHGRIAFGEEIEIRQGAEIGRPSLLHARADGTAEEITRVEVGGSAIVIARAELVIG